jgi:hypothetical protein
MVHQMDYVEEVKNIIRMTIRARAFVSRANGNAWRTLKQDFIELYLAEG